MSLDRDRWLRIDELFDRVSALEGEARAQLLRTECGDDTELRAQVEALLRAHDTDVPLLDRGRDALIGLLADEPSPPLARVGPYRILREVGRGGMGVVYLAERDDADFHQQVAIKCLLPGVALPQLLERFRRERRIVASLVHSNIARLYDGGVTESGAPYFVMEYVEGEPLDVYCDRLALSVDDRLRLFATVCDAVQYAHQHLIVHRDLKPGNVLVSAQGQVKLLDFGIAKLLDDDDAADASAARTAQLLTPAYASPEQVEGAPVTAASDVFSLALMLFELLTGRKAFASMSGPLSSLRAVLESEPLRASDVVTAETAPDGDPAALTRAAHRGTTPDRLQRRLRGDLDVMLERALRKEPSERYASAQSFVDDIRRHLKGEPIAAQPASVRYRAGKFVRRHRVAVLAGAAVLAAVVGGAGVALWQAGVARRERDLARLEATKAERVTNFVIGVFQSADPNEALGTTLTAREILERGTRMIEGELSAEPVVQATVRRAIGRIYLQLSDFKQAHALIEQSLAQHRQQLGPDHVEVAEDLHALASVSQRIDVGASSDSLYTEVAKLYRQHYGANHIKTGEALRGLALARLRSDTTSADTLFRNALAIFERNPGQESHVADVLNDIGFMEHNRGNYKEAERYYREASALRRRTTGEDNPRALVTLSNLGWLMQLLGRYDAADSVLQQTLATRRRLLGDRHSAVAATLHGLGEVAYRRERYEDAERYLTEALDIRREVLSPNSPSLADNLQMLASVAAGTGRTEEAHAKYREAIRVLEGGSAREGPSMARALSNHGGLYNTTGDYAAASALYRRSWQMYRKVLGESHPFTAIVQGNVGSALLLQDSVSAAEPLLRSALAALEKGYSATHPSVGVVLIDVGTIELRKGALEDAERTLRRAVEVVTAGMPAGSWRIAQAQLRLGRTLHARGRYADAEPLLLQAFGTFEPMRSRRARDYAEAALALEQLYLALNRTDDARRYRSARTAGS